MAAPSPTWTDPLTGHDVSVTEPVGAANSVPTSPTIVPFVHVTAALPSTVKLFKPCAELRALVEPRPEVTGGGDVASLQAAAASASANSAPVITPGGL